MPDTLSADDMIAYANDALQAQSWLRDARLQYVFDLIESAGGTGRVVGGAVRNALINSAHGRDLDCNDVDVASDVAAETLLEHAEKKGMRAIATGLQHGTVTLVVDGLSVEVTVLREDVETDGRHAVIVPTGDWTADAQRRDFTINALYCNRDGTLFDPLGGIGDIKNLQLRFIGDPVERIREDFLRILRFFRFSSTLGIDIDTSSAGFGACIRERDGLRQLSAERVRVELLNLLGGAHMGTGLIGLHDAGLLPRVLDGVGMVDRALYFGVIDREAPWPESERGIRRLASLAVSKREDVERLVRTLRLSGEERTVLGELWFGSDRVSLDMDDTTIRKLVYTHGCNAFVMNMFVLRFSGADVDDAMLARLFEIIGLAKSWDVPEFPVSGGDIVDLGVPPGPGVGDLLRVCEADWVASDFSHEREALLANLKATVEGTKR